MTDTLDAEMMDDMAPAAPVAGGEVMGMLTSTEIAALGQRVIEDYERDDASRSEWKKQAEKALSRAAQEPAPEKNYPWQNASNVNYPLLTVAALQFQARAYPAIVKNDEAIQIKVFGSPVNADPKVEAAAAQGDQNAVQQMQQVEAAQAKRLAKQRRAKRVGDYLNYKIFYSMDDWESDTDTMLLQLPIVGCAFRKTWYADECKSAYVPAMRLVVPNDAKSLETSPRVTEEIPDVYPYQIQQRQRSGFYRMVDLVHMDDDTQKPRMLLEQHRLDDLDGDGIDEPYVVTVDKETGEVLRVEYGGWPEGDGFDRFMPYTKYEFIPDPRGGFYSIGFGHLLDQITEVVNTSINQLIDAGHAQIAGGGFIASGLRLQGGGQTSKLTWRPGEYKTVNATGGQLREGIYERTFPNPSPVAFQMLDMMLGAAKDITSTSDVMTGEAASSAPVGTTLALIEQGLQVFTAIYKRVYRSLKAEFRTLYETIADYGNAEDYLEVVDDPEASFEADFMTEGKDVCPVSDPSVATRMQAQAKGSMLLQMVGKGLNDRAVFLRAFQAFDIDDAEDLLPPMAPQGPPPEAQAAMQAKMGREQAAAAKDTATPCSDRREGRSPATRERSDEWHPRRRSSFRGRTTRRRNGC
jgi:chaperonin GroES